MLLGDVAAQALPARDARGAGDGVLARGGPTRRRRGEHEDHLRAVQRGDRTGEGVPGVLADEHRRASPRGVEGADAVPPLHEALLVEEGVGGEEVLAMHVHEGGRRIPTEREVGGAVVQGAVERLVEAEDEVDRRAARDGGAIARLDLRAQRLGGERDLADPTLEEVAGEDGLREDEDGGAGLEGDRLREEGPHAVEIPREVPLPWPALGDRHRQHP